MHIYTIHTIYTHYEVQVLMHIYTIHTIYTHYEVQVLMHSEYESQAKREERLLISLADWSHVMHKLLESLDAAAAKAKRHHELAVEDLEDKVTVSHRRQEKLMSMDTVSLELGVSEQMARERYGALE
jgi:hypothetical protein